MKIQKSYKSYKYDISLSKLNRLMVILNSICAKNPVNKGESQNIDGSMYHQHLNALLIQVHKLAKNQIKLITQQFQNKTHNGNVVNI